MPRRKQVRDEPEITVWPSSLPEDVGSMMPGDRDLSMEFEELGSRFLSDAVEQGARHRPACDDDLDEPYFDVQMGNEILRSFGLEPMSARRSMRPRASTAPKASKPPKSTGLPDTAALRTALRPPRLPSLPTPDELDDFMLEESMEIDLTEQTIREASLLDHEADEAGEVESPFVRTDDVHSHLKRRGGHAASMRPPRAAKR